MNEVYILGGLRTPIGITNGIFKNILPEDMMAELLKETVKIFNINNIDEVILGNIVGPGGNISRLSTLKAGIDVPAFTIDMQCASALMAIKTAYSKIAAGLCDVIIVGGVESTSMEITRVFSKNHPLYSEDNSSYKVAQFAPGDFDDSVMIKGADKVAKKHNITFEELNFWSKESHKRAVEARARKILNDVIISIEGIKEDEGIKENISDRLLKRIKPILNKESLITPANACLTHDGAAVLVLCSKKYLEKNNLKELYKIVNFKTISGEASLSPEQSIKAIEEIMEGNSLTINDIDAFEVNEAFAVIDVLYERRFKNKEKLNMFGGALAYGHPYGASGAIISIHLLKALDFVDGKYGIVSIPAAGGLAVSMLIERIKDE